MTDLCHGCRGFLRQHQSDHCVESVRGSKFGADLDAIDVMIVGGPDGLLESLTTPACKSVDRDARAYRQVSRFGPDLETSGIGAPFEKTRADSPSGSMKPSPPRHR